jgi:isopentenyl diphosphate isomerase/L-lactate dehydrogenase-like FMN-dependent dehydrogenase
MFTAMPDVLAAARAKLPVADWDKLMGGTESETTLRRNRLGFDSLAFRPRVQAVDASVDASTEFLGHRLRIPVMLGPIGTLHRFAPDGGFAAARAATAFGTMPFVSSNSQSDFEEVPRRATGPMVLHLAIRGDLDWCADVLHRARAAGYVAVNITVDTARLGRQERQMSRTRSAQPAEDRFRTGLSWADVDRIRQLAGLPLIVKGIATGEDALIAVDHGIEAIDILPEVVEAAGGRATVIMDGGVLRGTDVVKALALGARATLIGKLQGIGLAAGGEDGLASVLEILEDEILTCLELLGVPRVDDLGPDHVRMAGPVSFPTETGAFPALAHPASRA